MKIEIGESLIYSFLRHEHNCLITQTNWKPSGNWNIPNEIQDRAAYEFNKINKHHAFLEIFKSDFNQTIKQAEIDVLGIDHDNHIYAFEVAFHENGLQYGSKIETRNRVFKKLLRNYIILKCYFPSQKHTLAFCSPKVHKETERHIQDYFELLVQDFQSEDTGFYYYTNEKFSTEIAQRTLTKTVSEPDSSELFARSIKLLNIINKFNVTANAQARPAEHVQRHPDHPDLNIAFGQNVVVGNVSIPLTKEENESVQDYVKKIMRLLLNNEILSNNEIENLQNKDYCKRKFSLQFPLLRRTTDGYLDDTGRGRYWSRETFGGEFYVCSQWWKDHHPTYLIKLREWLMYLQNQ